MNASMEEELLHNVALKSNSMLYSLLTVIGHLTKFAG